MRVINHRQFVQGKRPSRRWLRITCRTAGIVAVLLVAANGVLWVVWRGTVPPNYSVGAVQVGGLSFDRIAGRVTADTVLPKDIALTAYGQRVVRTPAQLGLGSDTAATIQKLKDSRPAVPLLSLFMHTTVPVQLSIDSDEYNRAAAALEPSFSRAALGKHITYRDGNFVIADPAPGYNLDKIALKTAVSEAAAAGRRQVMVPTTVTASDITAANLDGELQKMRQQLDAIITYTYGAKTQKPTKSDIAAWFVRDGVLMTLSQPAIRAYVQRAAGQMGGAPPNIDEAVAGTVYALSRNQPLNFRLAHEGVKIYRYCAAQRGLNDSVLADFRLKLAATLGDVRGWNDKGRIAFIYDEAGCQMHNWLAASSAMTGFGSICDAYYSCTVYPNVIINYDRWNGATDPWNAQRLSIEDYRSMVINHEGGHWLGFGHVTCPGAGQPAPVMQQQSVALDGCAFNPWPTAGELADVAQASGKATMPERRAGYAVAEVGWPGCGPYSTSGEQA